MQKVVTINGVDYRSADDGVTHINIYSKGATTLGRFLSNFTRCDTLTNHGRFRSLEGYYHYLRAVVSVGDGMHDKLDLSRLEDLRLADGNFAQSLGRWVRTDLQKSGLRYIDLNDVFFGHFRDALLAKVVNSDYANEFAESTLPLTHYYVIKKGMIYHHPRFDWLSKLLEDIRDELVS